MSKPSRFPQVKTSISSVQLLRKQPVAPPVYHPQPIPKVLQMKSANAKLQSPVPKVVRAPKAPPVYRPQPVPKVLQPRMAGDQQPRAEQKGRHPVAPPAYLPMPIPKVLQRKTAPTQKPPAGQIRAVPAASPVYRPQPIPKALQLKARTISPSLPQRTPVVQRRVSPNVVQRSTNDAWDAMREQLERDMAELDELSKSFDMSGPSDVEKRVSKLRLSKSNFKPVTITKTIEAEKTKQDKESLATVKKYMQPWDDFRSQREDELEFIHGIYHASDENRKRLQPIEDQRDRQEIVYGQYTIPSDKPDGNFLGVIDDNDLLQAVGTWEKKTDEDGDYLYIHELASAPWNVWYSEEEEDPRGRSYAGTTIMKKFVEKSIEQGCGGRIELCPWTSSPGFYLKLGFKKCKKSGNVELRKEEAKQFLQS